MFVEPLQFHLAVCAQGDLPRMARMDPNFWNLISIREPERPPIQAHGFKQILKVICYDMVGREGLEKHELVGIPRKEHIHSIFRFADSIAGEPILVHCWAGVSRSTAVALGLIVRGMHCDGYGIDEIQKEAPEILLSMRPQAAPNPLILELMFGEFLPDDEAKRLVVNLVNHPVLFTNRHKGGEPV